MLKKPLDIVAPASVFVPLEKDLYIGTLSNIGGNALVSLFNRQQFFYNLTKEVRYVMTAVDYAFVTGVDLIVDGQVLHASMLDQSISGLVTALNSLEIGAWFFYTGPDNEIYLAVYNEANVLGNLELTSVYGNLLDEDNDYLVDFDDEIFGDTELVS